MTKSELIARLAARNPHLYQRDVERIVVRGGHIPIVGDVDPRSAVDAQFSLPFVVAMAVTGDEPGPTMFSDERLFAPDGVMDGTQRAVAANLLLEHGTFYGGHRTAFSASRGRLSLGARFSVEPTYTVNWLDLPAASATTHLLGSRVTYTMTPRMFVAALVQYSSSNTSLSTNLRFRWEYQPGSEFFIVLNEQRDTALSGFPGLTNRALVLKINKLLRY